MKRRMTSMWAALWAATLVLSTAPASAQPIAAGSFWRIEVDPMTEFLDGIRREVRRVGAPLIVDAMSMDITSASAGRHSLAQRKRLIAEWEDELVDKLEDEDFEAYDEDDWESESGMSLADMREKIIEGLPYNMRDSMRERMGEDIHVLINQTRPACAGENGGMVAIIMSMYPDEDVRSDYGGIAVILMGAERCGRPSYSYYLSNLRRELQATLVAHLEDSE